MEGASIGFDQNGFFDRQVGRHMVVNRLFGELHVLGHAAVNVFLETVQVMLFAHPILTAVAEAALPAGNELF
jgi:hypothetical protein